MVFSFLARCCLSYLFDLFLYCSLLLLIALLPYFYVPTIAVASFSLSNLAPLPHLSTSVLEHKFYQAGYCKEHKQSEYIFYVSKIEYLSPNFKRKNLFRPDPLLNKLDSATISDYKNSGYDKGHILPAADMTFNEQALEETFYFSNISPQAPVLNRGVWSKLEALVRRWVKKEGELLVIAGPILEKEGYIKKSIGEGHVTVPWGFYKIVLNMKDSRLIAFILPNEPLLNTENLQQFVVSVREVEEKTGINFFVGMPEDWQDYWEKRIDVQAWSW